MKVAKKSSNKLKNFENDNYFFSKSIILNEKIERVWSFLRNPLYFKESLPSYFVNLKINQKSSSFCPGDDFSFYWIGVSNITTKLISIIDHQYIKKLILDVSINIGIYYRKTYNLYKITNNNSTLLKIILTKIPKKECEHANFVSFITLNPDLYSSALYNLNKIINISIDYLFYTESFIVDINNNDCWNFITDFQKLSNLNPNFGQNYSYQDSRYKVGSFIKCFIPKTNKHIFMKVKNVVKNKKNKNWIYALEMFGADACYIKQEAKIHINKIDDNKTQISVIHIFKQLLSKDYIEDFINNKKKFMKLLKIYLNNLKKNNNSNNV